MEDLRKHGLAPFKVAVIHGGPGARGEMAPVAGELATAGGVLEPLQAATTLTGQVTELEAVLRGYADLPFTLIGHSWGAWLSYIFAAGYPGYVKKLILVASAPFEERYAVDINETRMRRLTGEEGAEFNKILEKISLPGAEGEPEVMARFAALAARADMYDPVPDEVGGGGITAFRFEVYDGVWGEAADRRKRGQLLALGERIGCPVVAIHGDYDPHPEAGVREPLSAVLRDFRFILLEKCGHTPWRERGAREEFYRILKGELG